MALGPQQLGEETQSYRHPTLHVIYLFIKVRAKHDGRDTQQFLLKSMNAQTELPIEYRNSKES